MNALGMEESKVKFYGWIQKHFTGNTNGNGTTRTNFGVNPNNLANKWMGNQYYLIAEKAIEQGDNVNFGSELIASSKRRAIQSHVRPPRQTPFP